MQSRAFGLPLQFLSVTVLSLALTIYLVAWSAQARIEERARPYNTRVSGVHQIFNRPPDTKLFSYVDVEKQNWERIALFICPLH